MFYLILSLVVLDGWFLFLISYFLVDFSIHFIGGDCEIR